VSNSDLKFKIKWHRTITGRKRKNTLHIQYLNTLSVATYDYKKQRGVTVRNKDDKTRKKKQKEETKINKVTN